MAKIEAIIQPFKLDDVKATLVSLGIADIAISHVLCHGGGTRQRTFYRGACYDAGSPGVKLEFR